jgi:hypothetical protein
MDQIEIESKPRLTISLNEKEKAILDRLIKMDMFSSIAPYLSNILLDGCVLEDDTDKIKEFIIDWITDNEGNEIPGPITFIQRAIIDRIDGIYAEPIANNPLQYQGQQYGNAPVMENVNIDPENIPSYLNPVLTLIEREVRRRVKIEMKEHAGLQKKYDELKAKLENISMMFKV